MKSKAKITPSLWFDDEAEQAVDFYVGIFPASRIVAVSRYGEAGQEVHKKPPGSVMTIAFELDGQPFTALNGGPVFEFNPAISFQIMCENQDEIDHYWTQLSADADPARQQCGWLTDRYGVSWQVVPGILPEMMADTDPARSQRVMQALLKMKKLDINELKRAYHG